MTIDLQILMRIIERSRYAKLQIRSSTRREYIKVPYCGIADVADIFFFRIVKIPIPQNTNMHYLLLLTILLFVSHSGYSQKEDSTAAISPRYIEQLSGKVTKLDRKLDKKTSKAITRIKKAEIKIKSRLARTDSLKAEQVFGDVNKRYSELEQKLAKASSGSYIPSLDSMATSLNFLNHNPEWLGTVKDKGGKIEDAMSKVEGLKEQLGKAESLQQFIKERKNYFRNQLANLGFAKELKRLNKQVYYYSQQLSEYKSMLKGHRQAERKALEILSKTKIFREFMRKHGGLASLFRLPGDVNDPSVQGSLAGLQTRAQVSNLIGQQLAAGGPNAQAQLQQNLQQAQGQLNELKNKINQLGGSSSNAEQPEGFKPNNQKIKSLWDRLEYGSSIQSQKGTGLLPTTSDFGLFVGYKLNDKSIIGVGGSYKLGWGENIRRIKISHQGIGLRSFIDWKIKGSFWLSGGYEQNYRSQFRNVEVLKDLSAWQQSGLIGLSKAISLKTKLLKKTSIKLLWDFLSYQQVPRTQPILFRVGYHL